MSEERFESHTTHKTINSKGVATVELSLIIRDQSDVSADGTTANLVTGLMHGLKDA